LLNGNIGHNYSRMGDYENAVAYLMKCYEWEKSVNDYEGLSTTLTNLGVVYSQWQQPDMAILFFEEAERVERPLNRPYNYADRVKRDEV
jgi:tetratricopeptide (TPR) repeat protein